MLLKALLFFPFNTLFRNSGWLPASERIPLAFTECTFQSEPHRLFQLLSRFPSAYCHSCQTSVSIAPRQTHNHTHPFSQGRSLLLAHPDFANLTSVVREASFAYLTPDWHCLPVIAFIVDQYCLVEIWEPHVLNFLIVILKTDFKRWC